ncbi:MAG: phosphoesterase, partial [Chitinophagaceae bacterium]
MSTINKSIFTCCSLVLFLVAISCHTARISRTTLLTSGDYHSSYDDTTLTPDNSNILMPYNRFIDPAGTVIRWGNKSQENHSLDCVLLPGEKILAVEDRYGLAFIDAASFQMVFHLDYAANAAYRGFISTYSGIKAMTDGKNIRIFWGASNTGSKKSFLLEASWDGAKASINYGIPFDAAGLSVLALPNDIAISREKNEDFLYTVLNGNNQLVKIRLSDKKIVWKAVTGMSPFGLALAAGKVYVSNWAGPVPDSNDARETAGIPYGKVYIDPRTGATSMGTVNIFDQETGKRHKEVAVGLHPNDVIASPDQRFVYVANGNSDNISVINTTSDKVADSIPVRLAGIEHAFIGHSPNALILDSTGRTLFVANGMDNAVAVIRLGKLTSSFGVGKDKLSGFIPTEAYPSGLALSSKNMLYIANLEGEGARVALNGTYNSHRQEATASAVPVPAPAELSAYTSRVERANMLFRAKLANRLPRKNISPKPVPERIGEPSSIKHVVYIIKENRTYDQLLGDMPEGNGSKALCIYGDSVTPNHHKLAREFMLMDNYYASGKSSAEGHQWTDAAIVTDYVEKNVQAWFNSY